MSDTQTTEEPTRWDLSNVYSGLEGEDFRAAVGRLEKGLEELRHFFDEKDVRRLDETPPAATSELADTLEESLVRVNALALVSSTLESFVYAYVSTDSYNTVAARELSKLELLDTRWQALIVRLKGWIGVLEPLLGELARGRSVLEDHAFFLSDTARQARFLMSEELEALAAELVVDGAAAFGKLQGNVTSQIRVPLEREGKTEELPITVVHNLCHDPDPEVRRRAYEAEIEGWKSVRTTVAACLNAVKGTAVTLARQRGRESVLDAALERNRIDRDSLDALMGSIREYFPMFRRYLKSKAAKLGKEQLAWWDIFAPVGESERDYSWREARDVIVEKFGSFNAELAEFAAGAFDRAWIDGAPRDGKRGGAFCMPVVGVDESRILANFDGSFDGVSTLAHELGHGFHNHCQRGLEPLRRGSPSTLAETASIFCETLVAESALAEAEPTEQLAILEAQLCGATQVCLDISSRYLFESKVVEERAGGELSADELCALMTDAQGETYGDGVDPETYHPYMWLWKPHYYSHGHNFYNFPYAFGHLFGLGLYAVYQHEGEEFVPRYKGLLRSTGQDYAAPLAERFGIDITTPDFWRKSLDIIDGQVRRYESL